MHHCKALPKPVSIEFYRPEPSLPRRHDKMCSGRSLAGRGVLPITAFAGRLHLTGLSNFFRVPGIRKGRKSASPTDTQLYAGRCLICRLGAQSMILKSNVKITVPDLPSPLASLFCAADAFWVTLSEERNQAFPARSRRIHHRSELTEKAKGNTVQGLGKASSERHLCKQP